jgi:hypothetical protein
MTIFGSQEKSAEALDWLILRDGGVALYWRRAYPDEDLNWFRQQGYQVFRFDCDRWVSGGMHADWLRLFLKWLPCPWPRDAANSGARVAVLQCEIRSANKKSRDLLFPHVYSQGFAEDRL